MEHRFDQSGRGVNGPALVEPEGATMATIYTDIDTRQVLDRRLDDQMRFLKTCGDREKRKLVEASFYLTLKQYEAACRQWKENNMVLIDGETFINTGGDTALAAKARR